MTELIATDAQQSEINEAKIDLFDLQLASGEEKYFHPGVNTALSEIKFRNDSNGDVETYAAVPIQLSGMEIAADGAINRPTLTIANIGSVLKDELGITKFSDLVGINVIMRTTLEKYLDNGLGNTSNPPVTMARVKYKIDRVAAENNTFVEFELAVAYDLEGVQLPKRVQVGQYCSWLYQGHGTHQNGGCTWNVQSSAAKPANFADGTQKTAKLFFNIKDEPLCLESELEDDESTWTTGVNYGLESYVTRNSKYYLCKTIHTSSTATTPGTSGGKNYWVQAHPYTVYSASTSYSIGDLVQRSFLVNGVTVDTVWKSTTNSNAGNTPSTTSPYWTREEGCGKTINSCRCRFQGEGSTSSGGILGVIRLISGKKTNNVLIPFAGFPGTARF